ncbi:hypothetical protein [Paratractidigestivibacter sp.]|uniref:hypothetical protein n=1 Tax=Paratractidigestivibacter sp. TaxID=2847316 RepID=UPI002ABDCFB1|nr:hypothetical protein [Paratractidigestivibacter sp.]
MKFKTALVGSVLVAAVGYVFYEHFLSDEAKSQIEKLAHSVTEGYSRISEVIESINGQLIEDTSSLPNVQATQQQWQNLGY